MNNKILKIVMIVLDIIVIPLLFIQLISNNKNIIGLIIILFANFIIFIGNTPKKKGRKK